MEQAFQSGHCFPASVSRKTCSVASREARTGRRVCLCGSAQRGFIAAHPVRPPPRGAALAKRAKTDDALSPGPEYAESAGWISAHACVAARNRRGRTSSGKRFRSVPGNRSEWKGRPSTAQAFRRRGVVQAHLQSTFRQAMGITPRQYADAIRVARTQILN